MCRPSEARELTGVQGAEPPMGCRGEAPDEKKETSGSRAAALVGVQGAKPPMGSWGEAPVGSRGECPWWVQKGEALDSIFR